MAVGVAPTSIALREAGSVLGVGPHAVDQAILQNELVPQRRENVDTGKRKQGIGQVAVQVLGGMEYGLVGRNAEVDLEQSKIKNTAVVNEGDDSHNRDHEHQCVQR